MVVWNRKTVLPVLIWTLLGTGAFLGGMFQQRGGFEALPYLSLRFVFSWVACLNLLYLVLIWPISLERSMERFARQPLGQGTFFLMGVQEPGLLLLYNLPILIAAGAFADKGLGAIFHVLVIFVSLGFFTITFINLGFYVHGNVSRAYFILVGILFVVSPLVNEVCQVVYGEGPAFLLRLNPFYTVFRMTSVTGAGSWSSFTSLLVFGGAGFVLLVFPVAASVPPRFYRDLPFSTE